MRTILIKHKLCKPAAFALSVFILSITASITSCAPPSKHFVTTWKTDNKGTSGPTSITIPTTGSGYSYDVDWNNDGTFDQMGVTGNVTHDFGRAGIYTIQIRGSFPRIYFCNEGDKEKILSVDHWGSIKWSNMAFAFAGASNLIIKANDTPDLSEVSDLSNMFRDASALTTLGTGQWDVSHVTNMYCMFGGAKSFNGGGGISSWKTGKVTDMAFLFYNASSFNQPIGKWDTSEVRTMNCMFCGAASFNQAIGNWKTSKVNDMAYMFRNASSFNQPIGKWDTSGVRTMNNMFCGAASFNQAISDWNTGKVHDMAFMFSGTASFNQPIGKWNTSEVCDMKGMFYNAISFNQSIGNWNTANVTNMSYTFKNAASFNQPIGKWNTGKVIDMKYMFKRAIDFNQPIEEWDTSCVSDMTRMFDSAFSFDKPIGHWDISSLTQAVFMFNEGFLSTANYDNILIGWNKQQHQSGVAFDGGDSRYDKGGEARANLITQAGWTITDGGSIQASEHSKVTNTATSYDLHGMKIEDKYLWMENNQSEKLQKWMRTQNYTSRQALDKMKERDWIYQQLQKPARDEEGIRYEALRGHRLFYWRKNTNEAYKVFCTRENASAPEEVLINPNEWKNNHYVDVEDCRPSPDGRYVAFLETIGGDIFGKIKIIDVKSKALLSEKLLGLWQVFGDWEGDNLGFYYIAGSKDGKVSAGDKYYWRSVYHHRLGVVSGDEKIFSDDKHKDYWHSAILSEEKKYLILYRGQGYSNNEVYLKMNEKDAIQPIIAGMGASYGIGIFDDKLFISTNDKAPNGCVFIADIKKPQRRYWKVFLPETQSMLKNIAFVDHQIYAVYLKNAATQIKIYDFNGHFIRDLSLPGLGTASIEGYWLKGPVYVKYESFLQSQTNYIYDFKENRLEAINNDGYPCTDDTSDLQVEQVWYHSKDNTPISMFLFKRKSLKKNGNQPVILRAYGGFGYSVTPRFEGYDYALAKQGVIVAWPNLRGGGEYGENWHQAGIKEKKQNTIDDYIRAAEWLIANHYTNPNRLAAFGESNGGFIVAASVVQRPDLFKVVVCGAALLDMLRYHRFNYAETWKNEYGTSDNKGQFDYLIKYSPYYNVKANKKYPDILFTVGKDDSTVAPFHSYKMAAKMQEQNRRNLVLLAVYNSGHGEGDLEAVLNMGIDQYAFILNRLNIMESSYIKKSPIY
jgi:surface protein